MKYLIKDTTKEQRKKLSENAIGISLLGADAPTEETQKLLNLYIEGTMELDEVKKKVLDRYQKESR